MNDEKHTASLFNRVVCLTTSPLNALDELQPWDNWEMNGTIKTFFLFIYLFMKKGKKMKETLK